MQKTMMAITALAVILAGATLRADGPTSTAKVDARPHERTCLFTYEVHVPADAAAKGQEHLWVPLPQSDAHQTIQKLSLESPVAYTKGSDKEYSNSYAVFAPTAAQVA